MEPSVVLSPLHQKRLQAAISPYGDTTKPLISPPTKKKASTSARGFHHNKPSSHGSSVIVSRQALSARGIANTFQMPRVVDAPVNAEARPTVPVKPARQPISAQVMLQSRELSSMYIPANTSPRKKRGRTSQQRAVDSIPVVLPRSAAPQTKKTRNVATAHDFFKRIVWDPNDPTKAVDMTKSLPMKAQMDVFASPVMVRRLAEKTSIEEEGNVSSSGDDDDVDRLNISLPADSHALAMTLPSSVHSQNKRIDLRLKLLDAAARLIVRAKEVDIAVPHSAAREEKFVAMMTKLCHDRKFVCPDNGIGVNACEEIVRCFERQRSYSDVAFESLDLRGNPLGDAGACVVAKLLRTDSHLQSVCLQSTDMTSSGFAAIFAALQTNESITKLDMSTGIGSKKRAGTMYIGSQLDGLHALRDMLAVNSVLTHLNLSCCGLGLVHGGMQLLMDGLKDNDCLIHLDVSHNHLNLASIQTMCRVISNEASHLSLASINLSSNQLGSASAAELALCIRECQHINILNLSDNNIMIAGLALLTDAVADNMTFSELVLSGNFFEGPPAASHNLERKFDTHPLLLADIMRDLEYFRCKKVFLSKRINKAPSLRILALSKCGITDALVVELCNVLRTSNNSIAHLDLSFNEIANTGAVSVAELLKTDKTLTHIDLTRNKIGDEGGYQLSLALKENGTLQELGLSANFLAERSALGFVHVVGHNTALIRVSLDGNNINFQSRRRVESLTLINKRRFQLTNVTKQKQLIEKLEDEEENLYYAREDILTAKTDLRDLKVKVERLKEEKMTIATQEARASEEEEAVLTGHASDRAILEAELKGLEMDIQTADNMRNRRILQKEKAIAQVTQLKEQARSKRDQLRSELRALTEADISHPAQQQMTLLKNQQRKCEELQGRISIAHAEAQALLDTLVQRMNTRSPKKKGRKKKKI